MKYFSIFAANSIPIVKGGANCYYESRQYWKIKDRKEAEKRGNFIG